MQPIKSILHPEKQAYELVRSCTDMFDRRGSAPLCCHFGIFDTYGDGLTKHSPARVPQFHEITDACLSFAAAMIATPTDPEWLCLTHLFNYFPDESLRFALSVAFKEGKRQYYSLTERKISSSETKRNDRRYEEVHAYLTGDPKSALAIIVGDRSYDWLVRLMIADRLRDLHSDATSYYMQWEELWPSTKDLPGDWRQAIRSFVSALRAVQALDDASRLIDCARNNSRPEPEINDTGAERAAIEEGAA